MRLLGTAVLLGLLYGIGSAYGDDLRAPVPTPVALGLLAAILLIGIGFDRIIMRR